MRKIIWLSDLHFTAEGLVLGHDPRQRLDLAVGHINTHHADADCCVITGDLADRGNRHDYIAVRDRLDQLLIPWLPMVGNHDDRALIHEVLRVPAGGMAGFVQYAHHLDEVLLICLDTLTPGSDAGSFCIERQDWLDAELARHPKVPTIIFLHHPPLKLGLPMQDQDRLLDSAALLKVLSCHPQVVHLCIGHVHRPVTGNVGGIAFATLHSVLYQAPPPWPAWDWDSFMPAQEAPALGVLTCSAGQITLQYDQFCCYSEGIIPGDQ